MLQIVKYGCRPSLKNFVEADLPVTAVVASASLGPISANFSNNVTATADLLVVVAVLSQRNVIKGAFVLALPKLEQSYHRLYHPDYRVFGKLTRVNIGLRELASNLPDLNGDHFRGLRLSVAVDTGGMGMSVCITADDDEISKIQNLVVQQFVAEIL